MGSRQKSTVDSESDSSQARFLKMEAIKKKMQAMKVEKDNACDQADVSEEKMKAARIRAQKGEDEVEELLIKSRQLETELDMTAERLGIATLQLEEKEKQLAATELEMNALTRRVSGLEEDLEKTKILELEEELRVVANNLKSLEVAEEKANHREKTYKEQIKSLTSKLKQAEARAEFAEKSVLKLQKEVDRLEDELVSEQEKFKAITEELEQTFAEMSGY